MTWQEETEHGPVDCRGMIDHLWPDSGTQLDLKITEDASPGALERTAENFGYGIQEAAYRRGYEKVRPDLAGRVRMVFAFVEVGDVFAMNIVHSDGVFRELGERRWMRAVNTWGDCIKRNHWPAYQTGFGQLTAPTWALSREGYSFDER